MKPRTKKIASGVICLLIVGVVTAAVVNHRMTRPHEKGPNQTLVVGPDGQLEIRTEGCFLRGEEWPVLSLKAISLAPRVTLFPKGEQGTILRLIMENISPDSLLVEGADVLGRFPQEKKMIVEVSLEPGETRTLEWKLASAEEEFSFFVFGDNHSSYDVLETIRRDIMRERPLFVLIAGDLTLDGAMEEMLIHEEFANSVPVPYFTVLGNHDLEETKAARPYHQVFGPTYYSFWYGPAFFVIVDNAAGYISLNQTRWLNEELGNSRGAKRIFLFAHQPPYDPRRGRHHAMKPLISGAPLLTSLMENGGVDYSVFGHIHTYYEFRREPTTYIIAGNARGKGSEPLPFPHYVVFNVSDNTVEHTLRLVGNGIGNRTDYSSNQN